MTKIMDWMSEHEDAHHNKIKLEEEAKHKSADREAAVKLLKSKILPSIKTTIEELKRRTVIDLQITNVRDGME